MQRARTLIFLSALLILFTGCQDQNSDPSANPGARETTNTSNTARTNQVAGLSEPEAALIDAAMKGDTQRVKDLLDRKGVKVNMKDAQGTTPLALAAWFGHTDTAKLLIERGADVNAKKTSPDGSSVLAHATMKGHKYIVALLLDKGVNVNVKDTQGATPLALAAWLGRTDIAKLLIERGADVNAKKSSSDDSSVLMLATIKGHKDIVELLKKAGAK